MLTFLHTSITLSNRNTHRGLRGGGGEGRGGEGRRGGGGGEGRGGEGRGGEGRGGGGGGGEGGEIKFQTRVEEVPIGLTSRIVYYIHVH